MTSLNANPFGTACLRLGAGALLAGATLLGTSTSTIADPATACAAPDRPGFDKEAYEACLDEVDDKWKRGEITWQEWGHRYQLCCWENGGEVARPGEVSDCVDPDAPAGGPAQLPQLPGPTEATQPPPPQVDPKAPLPGLPPVQTR